MFYFVYIKNIYIYNLIYIIKSISYIYPYILYPVDLVRSLE